MQTMWSLRAGRAVPTRRAVALALRERCSSSGATRLAAVIERPPLLTPDPPQWELKRQAAVLATESKHKLYPAALTDAEEGPDRQRARLRLDTLVEREGSREGEGDRAGDSRSLDRCLARRLYLLVQVDGRWQFPQATWAPPEGALDGVLRGVEASCGSELQTHRMGNAPLGHATAGDGTTFFYKLMHVAGDVQPADGTDFAWLTKEELGEKLDPEIRELAKTMCAGPFA